MTIILIVHSTAASEARIVLLRIAQWVPMCITLRRSYLSTMDSWGSLSCPTWQAMSSVSNWSGQPGSGPGLNRKHRLVQFQTRTDTQPADSWRAKARPVAVHPRVWPGLARPVGSNLPFCISGFTLIIAFRYATDNGKISTLVHHSSFSMHWPP